MYEYRAKVKRVVDADTLDLIVDLGFMVKVDIRVRLFGIDAPEIHGVKKESEEYQRGQAAVMCVRDWLTHNEREELIVRSLDGNAIGQGKYGRWLVEVWAGVAGGTPGTCLNKHLVLEGHAVEKDY